VILTPTPTYSATASFTVSPTVSITATGTLTRTPVLGPLIRLHGLYPNPFSDKLKVYYVLKYSSVVRVRLFNVAGEVIYSTDLGVLPQGDNLFVWEGANDAGARVASGVYPMRVEAFGVNGEQDSFWDFAVVTR
jgi:flagellar hook assembly protein FlgD